jgi:hypothetical protein
MNESDRTERASGAPTVGRRVAAPVGAVWAIIADGWSYATWVVGTSRVRTVDANWPDEGARIAHSFGPWPLTIEDYTRVERCRPLTDLVLTARGWPVGEARVHLQIEDRGDDACQVWITEDATRGPGTLLPARLRHLVIVPRNRETLHRLALLAEGRHRDQPGERWPRSEGEGHHL